MSKVKLILDNNSLDYGEVSDIIFSLPKGKRVKGIVETDFEPDPNGSVQASDNIDPVIYIEDINILVGHILTFIDASISDPEQRKAAKDIYKSKIWDWYTNRLDVLSRTWRFDKGFEQRVAIK